MRVMSFRIMQLYAGKSRGERTGDDGNYKLLSSRRTFEVYGRGGFAFYGAETPVNRPV